MANVAARMLLVAGLCAVPLSGSSGGDRPLAEVRLSPTTLAPGDSGLIEVTFSLPAGLHVNADPSVEIRVPAQELVTLHGAPEQQADGDSACLKSGVPVRQRFAVNPGSPTASLPLDVVVTYSICSDTAGWCRMRSDTCRTTLVLSHP